LFLDAPLQGHRNAVLEVQWTSDGDRILSCSADKTVGADLQGMDDCLKMNKLLLIKLKLRNKMNFGNRYAHEHLPQFLFQGVSKRSIIFHRRKCLEDPSA
jgi:WD40 repeat protein